MFPTLYSMIPFSESINQLSLISLQVRFGFKMTEESEISHWNQVLQNPGKEYTSWHVIMEQ